MTVSDEDIDLLLSLESQASTKSDMIAGESGNDVVGVYGYDEETNSYDYGRAAVCGDPLDAKYFAKALRLASSMARELKSRRQKEKVPNDSGFLDPT